MQAVTANPAFSKVDQLAVRRSVLKLKNKLKRERAKNRIHTVSERRNFVPVVCEDDQEEEFKKQKNRISAQLSRDRKKEKVKSLEELNRQLLEECQRHKKENEMLKRQVKEYFLKDLETRILQSVLLEECSSSWEFSSFSRLSRTLSRLWKATWLSPSFKKELQAFWLNSPFLDLFQAKRR